MRKYALLLALAPIAMSSMAYAQVEPPIPPAPGQPTAPPMPGQPGVPPTPETPMPNAPQEMPAQPDAPTPSSDPTPEVPQPTPAPPTAPAPVAGRDKPAGPMATPRNSGAVKTTSGGTSEAELASQAGATKEYPVCSKTVTDNCVNRGERSKSKPK